MPSDLNEKFRLLYYKAHSVKWESKKPMSEILKIIEDIEKILRRHIDGKSD